MRGRRAGGRDEHGAGAAMVEAVLVMPIILMLTFGAIDFGMAWDQTGTLNQATRTAARNASALPRDPGYLNATLDVLAGQMTNLLTATPSRAWIYKAVDTGGGVFSRPSACVSDCVAYDWDPSTKSWINPTSTAWDASTQQACAGHEDAIGVYVTATQPFVANFFGPSVTLHANTIVRLEPFAGAPCS